MIEDELRTLLQDRSARGPDNPGRTAEVRSRVRRTRRRRVGAGVLCLAGLAVVGVLSAGAMARLHTLPPALPVAPPLFDREVQPTIAGFEVLATGLLNAPRTFGARPIGDGRPYLLAVHCQRPGILTVTGTDRVAWSIDCRTAVGAAYEGAVRLTAAQGHALLATAAGSGVTPADNLLAEPHGGGTWAFAVLAAGLPDWLPVGDAGRPAALDGRQHPAGGTFRLIPQDSKVVVHTSCAVGVILTFRTTGGRFLASGNCSAGFVFDLAAVAGPGAPPGEPVSLVVQRSGRDTDQWQVLSY
jgi:hypothetical protein